AGCGAAVAVGVVAVVARFAAVDETVAAAGHTEGSDSAVHEVRGVHRGAVRAHAYRLGTREAVDAADLIPLVRDVREPSRARVAAENGDLVLAAARDEDVA